MKESGTDKGLIDLIKDTLDNYEEQYILGSWENFLRRKKRRKRFILWFAGTGIAASLLIGWLGFRFIFSDTFNSDANRNKQVISNLKVTSSEKEATRKDTLLRQAPGITAENKNIQGRNQKTLGQGPNVSRFKYNTDTDSPDTQNLLDSGVIDRSQSDIKVYLAEVEKVKLVPITYKSVLLSPRNNTDLRSSLIGTQASDISGSNPSGGKSDIDIVPDKNLSDNARSRKFRFGISLSPGVTSTSTSSSINYSGGINTEFALSRKFQLSTGLQVERQNVINKSSDNPAWIPPGQMLAELIDIDMPINLKWKFLTRESSSYYLASGISSVVYLSEKYTTTSYTQKMVQTVEMNDGVPNVTYQLENVKTTEQETVDPLSKFDFAGRVNIILGFEHHISSGLYLHVEPYLKIPVSELATQNLRFTTSGITCKISF